MSMHPSLKIRVGKTKERSVLKRTERIKILMERGEWQKNNLVFGLPKIKVVRIKIKKEKTQEKPTESAATGEKKSETSSSNPSKG